MEPEELRNFLRENLYIDVDVENGWDGERSLKIKLCLSTESYSRDNDVISTGWVSLPKECRCSCS